MDKQMILTFTVEDGEITYDIENGDGVNCKALADVLTAGADKADRNDKPEAYGRAVHVARTRA